MDNEEAKIVFLENKIKIMTKEHDKIVSDYDALKQAMDKLKKEDGLRKV